MKNNLKKITLIITLSGYIINVQAMDWGIQDGIFAFCSILKNKFDPSAQAKYRASLKSNFIKDLNKKIEKESNFTNDYTKTKKAINKLEFLQLMGVINKKRQGKIETLLNNIYKYHTITHKNIKLVTIHNIDTYGETYGGVFTIKDKLTGNLTTYTIDDV